ncbi:flippase [Vibrio vulnificus]|uniref:flippase n=1 Tax=Vibrio vulnificus TaxID=672 RepID=UPI0024DF4ECD|nr:flippase [Vibrio vulnificus]MDK2638472.1 flippase [Vibrio vulnificus]MDK2646829.1 flippase [Vibrio vulnificus]MDK2664695.1 flippase [Vibrio vulnificus]MDK2690486.1 flippase [Vibrio vulnificus]
MKIKLDSNSSHALWLVFDKSIKLVSTLLVIVFMTRVLGPEKFGEFSYVQSIFTIIFTFSLLGLESILVKKASENNPHEYIFTAILMRLLFAALIIPLLLIYGVAFGNDNYVLISIMTLSLIATAFHSIDTWYHLNLLGRFLVKISVFSSVILLAIKFIVLLNTSNLYVICSAFAFDGIFVSIGLIALFGRSGGDYRKLKITVESFSNKSKELLSDSWPLILNSLIVIVYMRIDQLMIRNLLGDYSLGVYSVAVRLTEMWYFVPTMIVAGYYPKLLKKKKEGQAELIKELITLAKKVYKISYIAIVLIFMFSGWAITLLFGDEFLTAKEPLSILLISGVIVSLGLVRGKWIVIEELQRYTVLYLVSGLIANVILNLILIPRIGITGAALATLLSQTVGTIIMPLFVNKTRYITLALIKATFLYGR